MTHPLAMHFQPNQNLKLRRLIALQRTLEEEHHSFEEVVNRLLLPMHLD